MLVAELRRAPRAPGLSPVLWCPGRPLHPPATARPVVRTRLPHAAGEPAVVLDLHGEPARRAHARPRYAARHGALLVAVGRGAVLLDVALLCVGVPTAEPVPRGRPGRSWRALLSARVGVA